MMEGKRFGRVRVVERGGEKLEAALTNRKPWKNHVCSNEDCKACLHQPGACRKINATYEISCNLCTEMGRRSLYIGETHRGWGDRLAEHLDALKKKDKDYATIKHWMEHHPEEPEGNFFSFKVTGTWRSSLERQIREAIKIANSKCDVLLNKKGEWGLNLVPSMGIGTLGDQGEWPKESEPGPRNPRRN